MQNEAALDTACVNTIRTLSMDAVQAANNEELARVVAAHYESEHEQALEPDQAEKLVEQRAYQATDA